MKIFLDALVSLASNGIQGIGKKPLNQALNRFFLLLQRKKEEPELKIKTKNKLYFKIEEKISNEISPR